MADYLYSVIASGEGQVNDQTKLLVSFVHSVQQLPGAEDVRTLKVTVQRLREEKRFSGAATISRLTIDSLRREMKRKDEQSVGPASKAL